VASFLKRVGASELEVIPGISSFQYMFAQLKMTWKDFSLASMHGRESDLKKKKLELSWKELQKYKKSVCEENGNSKALSDIIGIYCRANSRE